MENYRKVKCEDRLPARADDLENLSITVPAAWEFPAGEGTQIISSFYDFLHNEWVVNITEFHHPCKFAGYWFEPTPTPEPPTAGPTIQGKGGITIDGMTLDERLMHLKKAEMEFFNKYQDDQYPKVQQQIYRSFSNQFEARRHELEMIKLSPSNQSKGDEVNGVTDEATIAHNITTRILNEHRKHSKTLKKDEWAKIAGKKIVADLQHSGLLQPTLGQGEWISYENYMPPLAPPDECYNEQPWSIIVDVLLSNGREAEGVYDFTYRTWCEPEFEAAFDSEADVQVTHWRLKPPANKKG